METGLLANGGQRLGLQSQGGQKVGCKAGGLKVRVQGLGFRV